MITKRTDKKVKRARSEGYPNEPGQVDRGSWQARGKRNKMKIKTAISQVHAIIANFNVDAGDLDPHYVEDHPEYQMALDTIDTIYDILIKIEKELSQ